MPRPKKEKWYATITLHVVVKDAPNVVQALKMAKAVNRQVLATARGQDGTSVMPKPTFTFSTQEPSPPVSAIHG
jgi:hypothetical protein